MYRCPATRRASVFMDEGLTVAGFAGIVSLGATADWLDHHSEAQRASAVLTLFHQEGWVDPGDRADLIPFKLYRW